MSLLYIRDKDGKLVPVPALNYVLTEEDKQEIAELAAEMVEVPEAPGGADIPMFDLAAIGFPNLVVGGDPLHIETDTTEIAEILATSGATLSANFEYGGLVISDKVTFLPHSNIAAVDLLFCKCFVSLIVGDGKIGIYATLTDQLPKCTEEDNGKFLRVVDGAWAAVALQDVSEVGL